MPGYSSCILAIVLAGVTISIRPSSSPVDRQPYALNLYSRQTERTEDLDKIQDLNSFALGELEKTTGIPSYYVDEDYPSAN